jgi:hypothetical protein
MKKRLSKILVMSLVVLLFSVLVFAEKDYEKIEIPRIPNMGLWTDRVEVESEINPWDVFPGVALLKSKEWKFLEVFPCPDGDVDVHIVIVNPDKNAKIKAMELVVGIGALFIRPGDLISYSYIDSGKKRTFIYDLDKKMYLEYKGEVEPHGGNYFERKKEEN